MEFKDEVYWDWICKYQKLSPNFVKKFNVKVDEYNWLYKNTKFKTESI